MLIVLPISPFVFSCFPVFLLLRMITVLPFVVMDPTTMLGLLAVLGVGVRGVGRIKLSLVFIIHLRLWKAA